MIYRILGAIGFWTMWLTPFTFVFSFIFALKKANKDEEYTTPAMIASISLLLLVFSFFVKIYN